MPVQQIETAWLQEINAGDCGSLTRSSVSARQVSFTSSHKRSPYYIMRRLSLDLVDLRRLGYLHFTRRLRFHSTTKISNPPANTTSSLKQRIPISPHRAFYTSFARPIAKVFCVSIVTYQLVYYTWVKLEVVEKKNEMKGDIMKLEAEVQRMSDLEK